MNPDPLSELSARISALEAVIKEQQQAFFAFSRLLLNLEGFFPDSEAARLFKVDIRTSDLSSWAP